MLLSCGLVLFSNGSQEANMTRIFPELADFQKKGNPEEYHPDNLFEYINGAAEVFLSYDFEKLVTLSYKNKLNQSLTIDVYRHSNINNGFGIYSQEKPLKGNFISIGSQGYYEKGIINFFKGNFYVKLSGFDLGDNDQTVLDKAARAIASKLKSHIKFPHPLKGFPEKNRINNSEKFLSKNFMGYGFLNSAFVTSYQIKEKEVQVFIIEAENEQKADEMMNKYLAFVKKKGVAPVFEKSTYTFVDPYYRSSGKMNLRKKQKYLWGLLSDNPESARFFLDAIEKNLIAHKLIQ